MNSPCKHTQPTSWFARNWHKIFLIIAALGFLNSEGEMSPLSLFAQSSQNNTSGQLLALQHPGTGDLTQQHQSMGVGATALFRKTHINPTKRVAPSMALNPADVNAFLERFGDVARNEHFRYGVPASVILAAALLHSGAGTSDAATIGNNFFKLPCSSDWIGPQQQIGNLCLRKYDTAWLSFRDNTFFLTTGRFTDLKERFDPNDYRSWCMEIQERGYPGGEQVGNALIDLIEHYQLTHWD